MVEWQNVDNHVVNNLHMFPLTFSLSNNILLYPYKSNMTDDFNTMLETSLPPSQFLFGCQTILPDNA